MAMSSIKDILKRRAKKMISKIYDPLTVVPIGNQRIRVPFSHSLHENVHVHPQINFNLGRLVSYTEKELKNVKVIDVGANVGDTVAYIRNFSNAPVLCIDGDKKYLEILRQNVAQYDDVAICHALVGAEDTKVSKELQVERGTAFLVDSDSSVSVRTLDSILKDFPKYEDSKVLKIDTDGYDYAVIKGSKSFLINRQPVVFFEFDPFLFATNGEDPFTVLPFLQLCGYSYAMFYMSNGDFITALELDNQRQVAEQLVHYFSGRKVTLYADVCLFHQSQGELFIYCVAQELAYYRKVRGY
jgi:FkbM family methyltransferase